MSKLAAVIWEDRHVDVSVHLFSDRVVATEWARARAAEHDPACSVYEEETFHTEAGEVLAITYCAEGDRISVTECVVDAEAGGTKT